MTCGNVTREALAQPWRDKQVRGTGTCAVDRSQPGHNQASWYWPPAHLHFSINSLICLEWKEKF